MVHGFVRTLVKLTVASLIVGTIMTHFGITPDQLMKRVRRLAGARDGARARRA